jgi:hypothetical protein
MIDNKWHAYDVKTKQWVPETTPAPAPEGNSKEAKMSYANAAMRLENVLRNIQDQFEDNA